MYCPRCAAPHTDGAKFCRSCGTELESVSLVLNGKSVPPSPANDSAESQMQHWLDKRIESLKNLTTGGVLLAASLLLGLGLALLLPRGFEDVPWILIWIVFFGWLAVWGSIVIAKGLANLLESKSRLRLITAAKEIDYIPHDLSSTGEPQNTARLSASPRSSVTEGTTRHLDDLAKE